MEVLAGGFGEKLKVRRFLGAPLFLGTGRAGGDDSGGRGGGEGGGGGSGAVATTLCPELGTPSTTSLGLLQGGPALIL